jgi:hypothetical protein
MKASIDFCCVPISLHAEKSDYSNMNNRMRIYHRYLGFFLAGIMAVYALSGIVMIFRQTDFLKKEVDNRRELAPNLPDDEVGKALNMRDFKVERVEGNLAYFKQGSYDKSTGIAEYKTKQLPYVLDKMTKMHKATTNSPLFFLNIFFGLSLFFFVLSAFWMFLPKTDVFRKGLYFALAGLLFALIVIFV